MSQVREELVGGTHPEKSLWAGPTGVFLKNKSLLACGLDVEAWRAMSP